MAETMMDKLVNITNQLLDLGKRNRLLNYKDQGMKTLRIVNENVEEIFKGLTSGKEFSLFGVDPTLTKLLEQEKDAIKDLEEQDMVNHMVPMLLESVKTTDYNEHLQFLAFKKGYSVLQTLKGLSKEYHFSVDEKGINSLYISFGFINYVDEEEKYKAPILLVPIELDNESGSYIINEYEDEVLLNPTLAYYYKSKYNVDFPEYNYTKLSTFFEKLQSVLPEGSVIDSGVAIGIYSFYKMNMYNDLMSNKEVVIKNDNIRILLGEPASMQKGLLKNQPTYPVVNYDSSQLEAIKLAANGKSFCLQGPPGSGKSQTITNIIASLLGAGKKILFVSEKIAALRVVFENLRRAGLSDFAIELHSNKTNKKEFIADLYKSATAPKYDMALKTAFLSSRYEQTKHSLRQYEAALHNQIPNFGINLLELYSLYLKIKPVPPIEIPLDVADANLFDVNRKHELLLEYMHYADLLGYDYRENPLYGLNTISSSYLVYNFSDDLDISLRVTKAFKVVAQVLNPTKVFNIKCIDDAFSNLLIVGKLCNLQTFNPNYLVKKNRSRLIDAIENYQGAQRKLKGEILTIYDKNILNEDLGAMYSDYADLTKNGKLLMFNKRYKEITQTTLKYRNQPAKNDVLLEDLSKLARLKADIDLAKEAAQLLTKVFGNLANVNLNKCLTDLKYLEGIPDIMLDRSKYNELRDTFKTLNLSVDQIGKDRIRLVEFSKIFDNSSFNVFRYPIEEVEAKLEEIHKYSDDVMSFMEMIKVTDELYKLDGLDYLHEFMANKFEMKYLADYYLKMLYHQKIRSVIASSAVLSQFTNRVEDEINADFKDLDERILNINRDYIISENSRRRPDPTTIVEGSKFKILDKEYNKTRRQIPIRQLLDQIFELALDVKPVFLMSPLSVSTYLASELNMFDCVVFDEASQIFASDALGSIYRAKQCIVIGDTKQMPPTAFFQATGEEAADVKEYDLESILDKASNQFETSCLKWHYRSRSEELITFSNKAFYNSDLISIPQARKHEKGFGIDYEFVETGRYDGNTRTNPIEANHIVDMVFDHLKHSDESLGVVAFSNVQAELIADLVDRRIKKNPELAPLLTKSEEEPFFVKNLESVQGDERDRIIFSICYGYNAEGKFHQRFGPLNGSGGERRLNVAVTRAKFNITIVASIRSNDINTENTESLGVKLFKEYLAFAENVTMEKKFEPSDSGVMADITEFIESQGYKVLPNYGTSSFRIDLAVEKDDALILAIMVDTKGLSNSLTDKYRLEKLLLERLGWKYIRLYSTSWITENENEKERLSLALKGELPEVEPSLKLRSQKSYLEEDEQVETFASNFDDYRGINNEMAQEYYEFKGLAYVINEMIKAEAPIHEDFLFKKVADMLDKPKVNKEVKDLVLENLPKGVQLLDDKWYVFNPDMEFSFKVNSPREVAWIYPAEITVAVSLIIEKNRGITTDGVYKSMTQLLDLEKVTPTIKKLVDKSIEELMYDNIVVKKDKNLYFARDLKGTDIEI